MEPRGLVVRYPSYLARAGVTPVVRLDLREELTLVIWRLPDPPRVGPVLVSELPSSDRGLRPLVRIDQ